MFLKAFILIEHVACFTSASNSHKKSETVIPIPKENPNSSRFSLMDLTNRFYHSVNKQFQAFTGIDFATAQSKRKEIGL